MTLTLTLTLDLSVTHSHSTKGYAGRAGSGGARRQGALQEGVRGPGDSQGATARTPRCGSLSSLALPEPSLAASGVTHRLISLLVLSIWLLHDS